MSTPETHQLSRAGLSPNGPPFPSLAFAQHACEGFGHSTVQGGTG